MAEKHGDTSVGLANWLTGMANQLGMAWWVEVMTSSPRCTYYFGPFLSAAEAEQAKFGYVEDLEREGAQGIRVAVKRCKPVKLTFEEIPPPAVRSLSSKSG